MARKKPVSLGAWIGHAVSDVANAASVAATGSELGILELAAEDEFRSPAVKRPRKRKTAKKAALKKAASKKKTVRKKKKAAPKKASKPRKKKRAAKRR